MGSSFTKISSYSPTTPLGHGSGAIHFKTRPGQIILFGAAPQQLGQASSLSGASLVVALTGAAIGQPFVSRQRVAAAALAGDERIVYFALTDPAAGTPAVTAYDVESQQQLMAAWPTLGGGKDGGITSIALHPHVPILVCATRSGIIFLLDAAGTLRELARFQLTRPGVEINNITFCGTDGMLCAACNDRRVYVFDVMELSPSCGRSTVEKEEWWAQQQQKAIRMDGERPYTCRPSETSSQLLAVSGYGYPGTADEDVAEHEDVEDDGERFDSATITFPQLIGKAWLRIYNKGKFVSLVENIRLVISVAWLSPTHIAVCCMESNSGPGLLVFDVTTKMKVASLAFGEEGSVYDVSASADGKRFVVLMRDHHRLVETVQVFELLNL